MHLGLQYYSWSVLERRQFRKALLRATELEELSTGGYIVDKNRLPKEHPAIKIGYVPGDVLDASLELKVKPRKR